MATVTVQAADKYWRNFMVLQDGSDEVFAFVLSSQVAREKSETASRGASTNGARVVESDSTSVTTEEDECSFYSI